MSQRLISFNLLCKYHFILNSLFFDFSFRYSKTLNAFLNIGPLSSSFFFNFLADSSTFSKIANRGPWLFLELSQLSPIFFSGTFKWVSRKKTLLLHLVVTSYIVSSSLLHFIVSLFSIKSPIGVLLNHSSFFFFSKIYTFRLLVVDVTKLKRISGDIFYNWYFKFQLELSFITLFFVQLFDLLSLYVNIGSSLLANASHTLLLTDA